MKEREDKDKHVSTAVKIWSVDKNDDIFDLIRLDFKESNTNNSDSSGNACWS